jgi:carboxypeptidase PM20D1
MAIIRKIAAVGGLGLLAVCGIVAARTAMFEPAGVADARGIIVAAAPDIDVTSASGRLGAAVRFQTVSHQDKTRNDTTQWAALQSWLISSYPKSHAVMTREIAGDGALVYTWQGSDPSLQPIILMAHQDVVPVTEGTEDDWKYPPFEGRMADGAVWGRGTVDDKGSLVALFEATEALLQGGFAPERTIILISGHDEEAGGTGAQAAAKLLADRKVKALFTLDEGSAVITDAPVINAPATMIGIAEKGYGTLKITAKATGGHSSMPPDDLASIALAKAMVAIHAKQFDRELRGPGADMVDVLGAKAGGMTKVAVANQWLFGRSVKNKIAASPSGAAMLHTTIAPTMLQGSPKENVLPQVATGLINYRIAPWNSSADLMARAKSAVGNLPVELSWSKPPREPTPVSSTRSQGWKLVRAAAEAATPGATVTPFLVLAGTDSRSMTAVSQDIYRFAPIHFKTSETGMIHGTNEHMTLANLERLIKFYAQLMTSSAG